MRVGLYILLIFFTSLYADNNANSYDENRTFTPSNESYHTPGHIFDSFKAYLMYGYEYSNLTITNEIQDSDYKDAEGNVIDLADGGKYAFKSIQSKYKKLLVSAFGYDFTYSITGTDVTLTSAPWDLPQANIDINNPDDVYYLATEFLGGKWPLSNPNTLLGHESKLSLIYRKAKFEGFFKLNDYFERVKIDKSQYGIKWISDSKSSYFHGTESYLYYKFFYEKSVLPQVIYFQNGYEDLDEHFTSNKYTLSIGTDWIAADTFIYGIEGGLGYSSVAPGLSAQKRIRDVGLEEQVDYSSAIILYGAAKLGLQYNVVFEYTSFNINLLYNVQYLSESSSEVVSEENDDDGKMELIYDRSETLHNIRLNATWTF